MHRGISKNRTLEKSELGEILPLNDRERFNVRIQNLFHRKRMGSGESLGLPGVGWW